MTTTVGPTQERLSTQQHVVLDGISWRLYEQLIDEIGDRPLRVTFDRGRLEILSPLPKHEKWKARIARLIEMLCFELTIPLEPYGSTTFKREDLEQGLESDECYYIQHAMAMQAKDDLDLPADPPPDLAIEIDITSRSVKREPIYAGLGVPELWRFDGRRLQVLGLRGNGRYEPDPRSKAFPFLPVHTFEQFVLRLGSDEQMVVLHEFQEWVKTLRS